MPVDTLMLSLDTVIAASQMLGHKLEDRSGIRDAQDPRLLEAFQKASTIPLTDPAQQAMFLVAPLDILVAGEGDGKRFHLAETNGTGIGGLTNMPVPVIETILAGLTEMARDLSEPSPLVLVASSGLESSRHPRRNHLVYEKLLYAEALKRGFESRGGRARVLTMAQLADDPQAVRTDAPTVVLGYIKEYLNELTLGVDGRLGLFGRPVTAGVNDRFCLNVVSRFGGQVDLNRFVTMNRCFLAGADKGVAYDLLNEYARAHPSPFFPGYTDIGRADGRAALIAGVFDWLRRGRKVVIKPQGTGLGHGLDFFLDPDEPRDEVISRIDHSIRVTEHYYGAVGGAFPYTLCEFVDTSTIVRDGHPLHGHKYEVRVVVYRDGLSLRALPSIAKISSHGYDAAQPVRLSLINNITTSAEAKKREGMDFMLPLCSDETLALLGIRPEQIEEVCRFCTGYVRHILDQAQQRPERLGLPPGSQPSVRPTREARRVGAASVSERRAPAAP
jgi:hypothetical protein